MGAVGADMAGVAAAGGTPPFFNASNSAMAASALACMDEASGEPSVAILLAAHVSSCAFCLATLMSVLATATAVAVKATDERS